MTELSIIIPTLNAAQVLGPTLSALAQMESVALIKELVVSDGGSEDGTQTAVINAGANLVEVAPGRGGQLRAGADAARGNWFLFLHADTVLARGWGDNVRDFIERSNSLEIAGYFEFALDDISISARRLERAETAAGANPTAEIPRTHTQIRGIARGARANDRRRSAQDDGRGQEFPRQPGG